MLDHIQRVKINVSVEPLDADSAVHAERPQIRFEDEGPAVGIFAGNDFEAFAWSNDGVAQRLDRDGVLQSVRASSGCGRGDGIFGRLRCGGPQSCNQRETG